MNYFEKLFLGTSLLFGIVLVFLLGLYFDMGDVFSSSINKGGYVTRGTAIDRLVDNLARTRRTVKRESTGGSYSFGHVPRISPSVAFAGSSMKISSGRYYKRSPRGGEELVTRYTKYLHDLGFKNSRYIQMKALAQNRTILRRSLPVARKLSASGDFEEAILVLEEALGELPEDDYEQREQLVSKIVELCLRGGFIDKGRAFAEKRIELESKVLGLESESKLMEKKAFARRVKSDLQCLEKKQNHLAQAFASMEERQQKTGKYNGIMAEEKVAFKAEILGLKSRGEISSKVYSEMLDAIK